MNPETGQSSWALYDRCGCGAGAGEPCRVVGDEPRGIVHNSRPYTLAESSARGLPAITPAGPYGAADWRQPLTEFEKRAGVLPVALVEERTEGLTLRDLLDGLLAAAAEPDFDVDSSCRDEILRRFGERTGVSGVHASPRCACGTNEAGQRFVDPLCRTKREGIRAVAADDVAEIRCCLDSSFPSWKQFDHRIADALDRIEAAVRRGEQR